MEITNNEPSSFNEIEYGYNLVLSISKEHNFDLYKKLKTSEQEINNLHLEEKIKMNLCKEYLPMLVKDLFDIEGEDEKRQSEIAIKTISQTIKETDPDPFVFMSKLAQDTFRQNGDANTLIGHLLPRSFLKDNSNEIIDRKLLNIFLKRAPDLYQRYMKLDLKTKLRHNIASLHFR